METEAEQMERFYGSVEKMWPAMKRQMRDKSDRGGWQGSDFEDDLIAGAVRHIDAITENWSRENGRQHIIDAVNYLVMAYERLTAEEAE